MKLVILESPYAGDVEFNVRYARACMADSLARGEAPMVSHLLYTQCLDDSIPAERKAGIEAGLAWRTAAECSVVYTDLGVSDGMQHGIDTMLAQGKPVEYRSIGGGWKAKPAYLYPGRVRISPFHGIEPIDFVPYKSVLHEMTEDFLGFEVKDVWLVSRSVDRSPFVVPVSVVVKKDD
ncbi:hypothetical protein UFOVP75_202 [uncultured Caudovirales phage]|uniref:DUF7768 domain-containing protein n=1 Tax=uncultured Caudovirales phage TaxID=2100421 RepID=A0A6J5L6C6_9CAUD|nr:hypothetical protein UFOVP75_202 [uncultured Caudovirales phage]